MIASKSTATLKGSCVTLRSLQGDDAEHTFGRRQGARAILLNAGAQSIEQQAQ